MVNWFTPLYLFGIYGIVRYFARSKTELKPNKINWTPLESVGVVLAIYFGAQVVGGLLVYIVPMLFGWDASRISNWLDNSVGGQFILIAVVEAFTLWFLYGFLKRRRATFRTLGLKNPKLSDVGYAIVGFVAYFLLYIVAVSIVKNFVPALNVDQHQQIGFEGAVGGQLIFVFVSLVLLPPFAEELLVRGFLYSGLKKGLPKLWAILATSGLFAIAHLQAGSGEPLLWIAAIDTFVLSVVLIYLRDKTGRLWASIGLHMLKNLVAFLSLFVFHVI